MLGLDVLLGGVTGLVGNIVTSFVKYKNLQLELKHKERMVALETEAMKEEAKMQIAVTRAQVEGEVQLADTEAYIESLKAGQKSMFSEKWIDRLFDTEGRIRVFAVPVAVLIAMAFAFVEWLRGLMRPALTLYLTIMSSYITYLAWQIIQAHGMQTMSDTQAINIFSDTISIITYLTVSCVTWWFGDRTIAKEIMGRMKNK